MKQNNIYKGKLGDQSEFSYQKLLGRVNRGDMRDFEEYFGDVVI